MGRRLFIGDGYYTAKGVLVNSACLREFFHLPQAVFCLPQGRFSLTQGLSLSAQPSFFTCPSAISRLKLTCKLDQSWRSFSSFLCVSVVLNYQGGFSPLFSASQWFSIIKEVFLLFSPDLCGLLFFMLLRGKRRYFYKGVFFTPVSFLWFRGFLSKKIGLIICIYPPRQTCLPICSSY